MSAPLPSPTPALPTLASPSCSSLTLPSPSWVKLASGLLSHPPFGRCHLRIQFSTFSDGLILRKFDWNEESVS